MRHFNVTAPEGYADLTDIATYAAKKAAIGSAVNVVAGQQKLKEAIKGAGVNFAVAVIGRYGAQEIGRAYGGINEQGKVDPTKTKIGFVEHKLLHAGLGAIVGGIQGDPLAGAIGGAVAETVADTFSEKKEVITQRVNEKAEARGIALGSEEYKALIREEVKSTMDWSKIAAVTVAALADRDINISLDVATNALEHNFMEMISAHVTANALEDAEADPEAEEDGEEEELSEGTVTTISAEAPEEAAPAEQPRSRKGKEKARDENDYEDMEPSAPSSITEADYFPYGDDTEEFHEMMWNLTAGEKLLSNPIKESSASTSKGPVREDEEPRGRSREKQAPSARRHSRDRTIQNITAVEERYDERIDEYQGVVQNSENSFFNRLHHAVLTAGEVTDRPDFHGQRQLYRFAAYGKDAAKDVVENKPIHPVTKNGLVDSSSSVLPILATSTLAFKGGKGGGKLSKGQQVKTNTTAATANAAPLKLKGASNSNVARDVVANYNARQRNECIRVVSGQKVGTGANQNRQSIGAMYLQRQQKAANSNLLRMQKTGTGGSSSSSVSSFVSVGVGSTTTTKTIKTGGSGNTGSSNVRARSIPASNSNLKSMGTTLDGRREAKGKQKAIEAPKKAKLEVLRDRQGKVKGVTEVQEHHIISNKKKELKEHPIWEKANMNPDISPNTMLLPTKKGAELSTTSRSIHQGRHKESVHKRLLKKMERDVRLGEREGWTQSQYQQALKNIIKEERKALKSGDRILNKNHRPEAKDQ